MSSRIHRIIASSSALAVTALAAGIVSLPLTAASASQSTDAVQISNLALTAGIQAGSVSDDVGHHYP